MSALAHVGVLSHPGHAHQPGAQTRHLICRHQPALLQLALPVTALQRSGEHVSLLAGEDDGLDLLLGDPLPRVIHGHAHAAQHLVNQTLKAGPSFGMIFVTLIL